jgi:hypothetical protein
LASTSQITPSSSSTGSSLSQRRAFDDGSAAPFALF